MDKDDFSNIEVEDGENYSSEKKLGKEQIILRALQKCMDEGAKEMGNGGVITRIVKGIKYEFPSMNQREIFINSIKMFWSVVIPIIINKHKNWCEQELGNFGKDLNELKERYNDEKLKIKNSFNIHKSLVIFNADKSDLQSNYEKNSVELYRKKLDFGIMVIEKENWFGDKYA